MSHHKPAADALSIIRLKDFLFDDAKAEAAVKNNVPLELRGQNHLPCKQGQTRQFETGSHVYITFRSPI